MNEINWQPTTKDLRFFGLLLFPFSLLITWMLGRHFEMGGVAWVIIGCGVIAAVVGCLAPRRLHWIYVAWMVAVFPIGWLITRIVFAAVFFLVLTPIGIAMRLAGRKGLRRKFDDTMESYWEPANPADDKERYFRQF